MSSTLPGVTITETDISASYSTDSASVAFYSGDFEKGEMDTPTLITNARQFKNIFGRPRNYNDWYQVYNYLQYSGNIYVNRIKTLESRNASNAFNTTVQTQFTIHNFEDFEIQKSNIVLPQHSPVVFIARTPGEWGNSLRVAMFSEKELSKNTRIYDDFYAKDIIKYLQDDEYCIAIFRSGQIVEKYIKTANQFDTINIESKYVYAALSPIFLDETFKKLTDGNYFDIDGQLYTYDGLNTYLENIKPIFYGATILSLTDGYTGVVTPGLVLESYKLVESIEDYQIDIVIGNEMNNSGAYALSETRKDCISIIGAPQYNSEVIYRTIDYSKMFNSQYNVIVSNYKKQFDNFTGKNIMVNIAGDVAGIRARTDNNNGFYYASAGMTRGILSIGELQHSFSDYEKEALLKNNINFFSKNNGITYIDSQYTSDKNSAFGNINIRHTFNKIEREAQRLFRVLIFEENNTFTKNRALNILKPYLDNLKYSRAIDDYYIVCNDTNNKNDNTLVVSIFIKPQYVAQFIQINISNQGVTELNA